MKTISLPNLSRFVRVIALRSLLVTVILAIHPAALAAIKTWTGSSSGLWSVSANWSGGKPVNGDEIHFLQSATRRTMTNDIANLQVTFVWFHDSGSTNYVLRGNPLTIGGASFGVGGIQSNQTNGVNTIECDLNLLRSDLSGVQNFFFIFPGAGSLVISGDVALDVDGVFLRSDPDSLLELSGSISGAGDITLTGAGTTLFDGSTASTFTGTTFVQHGTLQLNKSTFVFPTGFQGRTAISGD